MGIFSVIIGEDNRLGSTQQHQTNPQNTGSYTRNFMLDYANKSAYITPILRKL